MKWPDRTERPVYLRLSYDAGALLEDFALIDAPNPLFFGLTPEQTVDGRLEPAVREADAMFVESDALEHLIDRRGKDLTAEMLSNALAQGGRGSFVGHQAARLSEELAAGFAGTAELSIHGVTTALSAIDRSLATPQAYRLERVLQAVWEGSNGRLDLFPGTVDTSGKLNAEALEYLVAYMNTDDGGFWRRVGRAVTIADLEQLDFEKHRRNVERLISANLDVLTARAACVFPDPLGLERAERESDFQWGLRDGHLSFAAAKWFAVVAESKKELEQLAPRQSNRVSVGSFVVRSAKSDLIEVTLHSGDETFKLRHDEGQIDTERLVGVAQQFVTPSKVTQALASSPSGRISVDLDAMTGTGVTKSIIRLADLIRATAPLLLDEPDLDGEALSEALEYDVSEDEGQPTLFNVD
ncbi:hypothetical protein DEJ25_13620 [Curtobacterium sp. MCPF17_011]|nr:hypothetical protein DEJ25_13620 [Curtobacterium sp. MCPF17_011]